MMIEYLKTTSKKEKKKKKKRNCISANVMYKKRQRLITNKCGRLLDIIVDNG